MPPTSETIATGAVCSVAALHVAFAVGELFLPSLMITKLGLPFSTSADVDQAARIVRNAGIYNAFVAAGLTWAVALRHKQELPTWWPTWLLGGSSPFEPAVFFLVCVMLAGLVGAVTLGTWKTLAAQTLLGAVALAAVWAGWR